MRILRFMTRSCKVRHHDPNYSQIFTQNWSDWGVVLDNLVHTIELATRRTDLLPVYSFNVEGLWLAKQRGIGQYLGAPERINLWQELLHRMKTLNGN